MKFASLQVFRCQPLFDNIVGETLRKDKIIIGKNVSLSTLV